MNKLEFMNLVRFLPVFLSGGGSTTQFDLSAMMQSAATDIAAQVVTILGIVTGAILSFKGLAIAVKFGMKWLNKIAKE